MSMLPSILSFLRVQTQHQQRHHFRLQDRYSHYHYSNINNINRYRWSTHLLMQACVILSIALFAIGHLYYFRHRYHYANDDTVAGVHPPHPHHHRKDIKAFTAAAAAEEQVAVDSYIEKVVPDKKVLTAMETAIHEYLQAAKINAQRRRKYPPHRYYHLDKPRAEQPDFLTSPDHAEYIYGEWPLLLQFKWNGSDRKPEQHHRHGPFKIAVDQSEWLSTDSIVSNPRMEAASGGTLDLIGPLPFADGTNPSIISIDRLSKHDIPQLNLFLKHHPTASFLATAGMTNSQCAWKDSESDIAEYHISTKKEPDTVRTVLLALDKHFRTIAQATIFLEKDASAWGKKKFKPKSSNEDAAAAGNDPNHYLPALDDAKLFVHGHQLFVSYREGPNFGYETQVLNPVHLSFVLNGQNQVEWQAHIRASETSSFCCGRNMALMAGEGQAQHLKALTWVDPVTTMVVDTTPGATNKKEAGGRRLSAAEKKSHIHGTNGFMVDLPSSSSLFQTAANNQTAEAKTFLGVAHFHRPNDRKANSYARFGHHYTHAFYTIQNDQLVGLSPEFVIPSLYNAKDAEIIQFISGLEYDASRDEIVMAYGINDCEAAVAAVDIQVIQSMLRPVEHGKQVVDYMKPLLPIHT